MKKVTVQCTFTFDVEMPDDMSDDQIRWQLEQNGCPGSGSVGVAFDEAIEAETNDDAGCWACALGGETKVLNIA